MYREFRELLEKATGRSVFALVVVIDIRGFSSFCQQVESPDVAMFIKRVYMRLIDEYFSCAAYWKPTGDGLLIILPYTEENLPEVIGSTLDTCLQLLVDFPSFCAEDPMINFDVPSKIGIGVARGTACRLSSGDTVLDYSGRILNLASRLMDFARPSGVVFDASLGIDLLSEETIGLFEKDSVYIRGIAEREPIDVYYSKEYAEIPAACRQPIQETKWETVSDSKTLKAIKDLGPRLSYALPSRPADPDRIRVRVSHDWIVRGKRQKGARSVFDFAEREYYLDADKPVVMVRYDALAKLLEARGVKAPWLVAIDILYPRG